MSTFKGMLLFEIHTLENSLGRGPSSSVLLPQSNAAFPRSEKKLANMWFNYTVVNYQIMLALKPALFLCKACVKRERELEGEDEREVGER